MNDRFLLQGKIPVWVDNGTAVPVLDVFISIGAGSAHDPKGLAGVAMLSSRMLRRGLRGMSGNAFEKQVAMLGAQVQCAQDGHSTTILVRCVARNAKPTIALVSEMLASPSFDEEQLNILVKEAKSELELARENVDYLSHRVLQREMFGEHPDGASVHGTMSSLGKITAEDLRAFHRQRYVSGNLAMAFAGQCTTAEAEGLAETIVSKLPTGIANPIRVDPLAYAAPKIVVVHQENRQQVRVLLGASVDTSSIHRHASTMIVNNALGGIGASLLRQTIREEGQMSYMAGSSVTMERSGGLLFVSSEPNADALPECVATIIGLLEQIRTGNLAREIIDVARVNHVNGHAFAIETAQDRVSRIMTEHDLGIEIGFFDASMGWAGHAKHEVICEHAAVSFAGTNTPCIVLVGDSKRMSGVLEALDWERVDVRQNDVDN